MQLVNEHAVGFSVPRPLFLETVLARLEALSQKPEFALQRELGLTRALKPYLQDGISSMLPALPQETELATLSLLCDFYPEDGQLTLIEQLRDVITEHIPEEERAWLDPLKHSYIDLLELVTAPQTARVLGAAIVRRRYNVPAPLWGLRKRASSRPGAVDTRGT